MQNEVMFDRLLKINIAPRTSYFLFGPRGTGKTTWIQATLPEALYLDLLKFSLYKELMADPGRLETLIPRDWKNLIVLDEVQRVPLLLHEVHRLIESKGYSFLLTGSSARSLRRQGTNLLAGRALHYHMHPLTIQELGDHFQLAKVLKFGLLPQAVTGADPDLYLETYLQAYLQQELVQEAATRHVDAFFRFLEVASFSQGSLLNITEIAREVGVARSAITTYFTILEDMLIARQLPPFTKRSKRRLVMHGKFYFFDVGVYRKLRPMGLLDTQEEAEGIALESLFFQSLLAINDYYRLGYKFFFWRTAHGNEVDFIAYGPQGFHAFEIKRGRSVSRKAMDGLQEFHKDYPEAKLYLLYLGDSRQYHGPIDVIPFEEALKALPVLLSGAAELPPSATQVVR